MFRATIRSQTICICELWKNTNITLVLELRSYSHCILVARGVVRFACVSWKLCCEIALFCAFLFSRYILTILMVRIPPPPYLFYSTFLFQISYLTQPNTIIRSRWLVPPHLQVRYEMHSTLHCIVLWIVFLSTRKLLSSMHRRSPNILVYFNKIENCR